MKKYFLSMALLLSTNAFSKPLTLILDWFINPDHAPLFVAKQQKFFKQEGLDVHILAPANASDGPKLVAAGKADIAIDYEPQLVPQVLQGLPLIRFATLVNKPLSCVIALKSGPIKTLSDLKGTPVAYTPGFNDVILNAMLKYNGLSLNDIKRINVNYNLVQALLTHNVAAFSGGMRNFEAIELKLAGQKPRLFLPEKNGVPTYDELIFVANKNEIHDPRLKKFVRALQKGVAYLDAHPNKTWAVFAKNHPELNNTLNHDAWIATRPYFDRTPGKLNQSRYANFTRFLKKQNAIEKTPLLNTYATQL